MEERERECILVKLAEIDAQNRYHKLDVSIEKWARLYDDVVAMHADDDLDDLREHLADILDEDEVIEFRRKHGLDPDENRTHACDDVDLVVTLNELRAESGAHRGVETEGRRGEAKEKLRFIRLLKEEVSLV